MDHTYRDRLRARVTTAGHAGTTTPGLKPRSTCGHQESPGDAAHRRRGRRPVSVGLGTALVMAGVSAAGALSAQRSTTPSFLIFDGVTVIDVEHGTRLPRQRVVITGNRIHAVGSRGTVSVPKGARIIDARGKYLIPGLWDMHTHPWLQTNIFYPLFLANGVTGIRDASSEISLDTLTQWRREIQAGSRVGPPRVLFSGKAINEQAPCTREFGFGNKFHTCVADTTDAHHLVDSLKAAGADMIKVYKVSDPIYFALAAAARRLGMPMGGHIQGNDVTAVEAADSGVSIIDHLYGGESAGGVPQLCFGEYASVEHCQPLAERFVRTNTWFVPTKNALAWAVPITNPSRAHFDRYVNAYWAGSVRHDNWLRDSVSPGAAETARTAPADTLGDMRIAQRSGLPILAGTDASLDLKKMPAGFSLHLELAAYVAEGLTPLNALQAATLNPAKMLRATDSLGTIASGRLADLVLLDADPLTDITNTTTIRAVVANGRYYDRMALDSVLAEVRTKVK